MTANRFVVLGVAPARAAWFRAVGQWAHAASVLIMASLGALMWIGFKAIWGDVETNTKTHVQEIGN